VAISPTSFGSEHSPALGHDTTVSAGPSRDQWHKVTSFGDPFATAGRYRPPWSIRHHGPCISGVTHFLTLTVERR
jgi:hypothetical protein